MIRIREAEIADVWDIMPLALGFSNEAGLGERFGFDPAWADLSIRRAIEDDNAAVILAVTDAGGIVGVVAAQAMSYPFSDRRMAKEIVLYVSPGHRNTRTARLLIEAYEAWARSKGCRMAGLSCFAGDRTENLYKRMGYAPVETHTIKVL